MLEEIDVRTSLLGPPGSGKGTQADAIRGRYGIAHVSSGDLLRAAVREGSELGVEAQRYMDAGQLVPSRLVVDLVRERVSSDDCAEGYLLDGFPRAIDQAEMLCGMLDDGEPVLDHVVALEVPEDEVVRRLSGRRNCPECAAIYHVEFSPPATDGVCDHCGSALEQRDDDREETIRQRLAVYREATAPLLEYYDERGLLRRIDGTGPPQDVEARVGAALE